MVALVREFELLFAAELAAEFALPLFERQVLRLVLPREFGGTFGFGLGGGHDGASVFRAAGEHLWPNGPLEAVRHLLPPIPTPGPEEPGPFSWADTTHVHRILEGAGFREVSLMRVDPIIRLAETGGAAEAADFVMVLGPLARVLPALSAPQCDTVRAALEVFFQKYATA